MTYLTQTPMNLQSQQDHQPKISDLIQPHFYALWRTRRPYVIARGGRGSFKSSTISLRLVRTMKSYTEQNKRANIICVRENATYLRDSVYNQIAWAIRKLNVTNEFDFRVSPMRIIHRRTGSTFYFYGGNDPDRLKSNIVDNIVAIWYEEAANFKGPEVFDQTNPTFIRQKPDFAPLVSVYYSYNPPRNTYDWINEWADSKAGNPNYFVDKSSYLDDKLGVTGQQQLDLIDEYKQNDYEYYRFLYLGDVIGLGTNIYNIALFHKLEQLPSDDPLRLMLLSVDTGHMQSATALTAYGVTAKGKVIALDTYYYSPAHETNKKPPSILVQEMHAFTVKMQKEYNVPIKNRTIDSAEGAIRNQYWHDYRIRWNPVNKLKEADMIDPVCDLAARGRVFYMDTQANKIWYEQHRDYQWDQKTFETDDPKVVKENDHCPDNFKYAVLDNRRLLGLER